MSYSFQVQKATKAEALAAIAVEFDNVVRQQSSHQVDRAHAEATAKAFVELLPDNATKDVKVYINGSVSGTGIYEGNDFSGLTSAAVQVQAMLVDRKDVFAIGSGG